jgi:hypothetical protein
MYYISYLLGLINTMVTAIKTKTDNIPANLTTTLSTMETKIDGNVTKLTKPAADSVNDATIADVVGTKADTTAGTSLISRIKSVILSLTKPGLNSANDATIADVVGTKADTTAGSSIISALKTLIANWVTPATNSAANLITRDVIGSKADDEGGNSLYSMAYRNEAHNHSIQKCYPTLADGITLTAGAAAWGLAAAFTEIIPVNTIVNPYDLHFLNIGAVSANDSYEVYFYSGLAGSEVFICSARFVRQVAQSETAPTPLQTIMLPANTRITAKLASQAGGGNTAVVSVFYHEY